MNSGAFDPLEQCRLLTEVWQPRVVAELNDDRLKDVWI